MIEPRHRRVPEREWARGVIKYVTLSRCWKVISQLHNWWTCLRNVVVGETQSSNPPENISYSRRKARIIKLARATWSRSSSFRVIDYRRLK
jgi:hypothetical protein